MCSAHERFVTRMRYINLLLTLTLTLTLYLTQMLMDGIAECSQRLGGAIFSHPLTFDTNPRSVYVSTWPQQAAVPPCTSARAKIHQLLNGSRAPIRMMRNLFALSNAPWQGLVHRRGNQAPKAMIGSESGEYNTFRLAVWLMSRWNKFDVATFLPFVFCCACAN